MKFADSGQRVVYLIDRLDSMHKDGRIELAKSQMLASMEMLEAHQEFQVILYDHTPVPMCLPGSAQDMYCASVANIKLAKERWGRSRGCEQHWYPALAGADGGAPFQVVRSVF